MLHPDDARRAVDLDIDGVIVSNHGGRQVDGSVTPLGQLPAVVEELGGEVPCSWTAACAPAPTC